MHTLIHKANNSLLYNLPSSKDNIFIKQLFKTDFYKFAKTNWNMDDILEGNSVLPFDDVTIHDDLEFNYIIHNKDQEFVGYIKGYYPLVQNTLWIQILAVNSPIVRCGYGGIIMKELILHLLEKSSIHDIYLTCHNQNETGNRFWTSLGFTKIYNIKSTHGLYKADLRSLTCIPNHLKP